MPLASGGGLMVLGFWVLCFSALSMGTCKLLYINYLNYALISVRASLNKRPTLKVMGYLRERIEGLGTSKAYEGALPKPCLPMLHKTGWFNATWA